MKHIALTLQLCAFLNFFLPAMAIEESDAVLDALTDEMHRSQKDLRIDVHPPPYFVSYTVKEVDDVLMASCLGSEPTVDYSRDRILTPLVRVGDYELDSTYPTSSRYDSSYNVSIDDDYTAMRRWAWLNTDQSYKLAIRVLDWKKAYLSLNNVPDRLPDMTHETVVSAVSPVKRLTVDEKKWKDTIQKLSAVFKNYPNLQKSKVSFLGRTVVRWYVNSEGTKVHDSRCAVAMKISASAQAQDGMPINDFEILAGTEESQMPSFDEMKKTVENFAQRITDLRVAPKGEEYCGPVLFEGQGAAELFSQIMAPNFGFAEEYIGSEDWRNPLKNALNRKILPKHISVIDDPSAKDSQGAGLLGSYNHDDEGMPAEKVVLVDNGMLKAFCQSRIPTRKFKHSNGHSLGGHGVYSILELKSSKTSSPDEIKTQLAELAKDAGLDYVLVVSRIKDDYQMAEYPSAQNHDKRPYQTPSYSLQPSNPVVVFKQYIADGRRELVRGLEFRNVSLRAFKDIQAVGADSKPYIIEPNDYYTRTLITPSYVIGELELTPVTPEHSTPPIVPSPLQVAKP